MDACNTKGWLLGNGFSLSYSHPWTGSGASTKAALPLHAAEPPLHSHPCPQLPHLHLWHSNAVGRNDATGRHSLEGAEPPGGYDNTKNLLFSPIFRTANKDRARFVFAEQQAALKWFMVKATAFTGIPSPETS